MYIALSLKINDYITVLRRTNVLDGITQKLAFMTSNIYYNKGNTRMNGVKKQQGCAVALIKTLGPIIKSSVSFISFSRVKRNLD